eukprot:TRINITY_DN12589_c0_g1_i1.p1 TRINITY_DN12589_c0_g1~~TRINITY_DN12589_c0_g1_i1.p1  ORF type:complete len:202 (-),score=18.59 TRINITY_DN12589_c0_g1_i1:73-678(-)
MLIQNTLTLLTLINMVDSAGVTKDQLSSLGVKVNTTPKQTDMAVSENMEEPILSKKNTTSKCKRGSKKVHRDNRSLKLVPKLSKKNRKPKSQRSPSTRKQRREACTWCAGEDERLLELVKLLGHKWGAISKILKTKTAEQCGQHYRRVINPSLTRGRWSNLERQQLIELVNEGGHTWTAIGQTMSRADSACRGQFYAITKK